MFGNNYSPGAGDCFLSVQDEYIEGIIWIEGGKRCKRDNKPGC